MCVRRAPRRRTKSPKVKGPSEHVIQSRTVKYLEFALKDELEFRAIPNGGLRKRSVAIALKAEGVKAGTPDTFVTLPKGLIGWIEFKTDVGSLLPEQIKFRDKVLALGHLWGMARSVKEALVLLTQWGALKPEWVVHEGTNSYFDYEEVA